MKFSIITINYNDKQGLEKTIKSVLSQSYTDYEYIVIDGGSTDGSVEMIKAHEDRLTYWVSEPDRGIYDALNKGLRRAHGEYVNCMNAGDTFASSHTLQQIVDENIAPGTALIYGNTVFAEPDGSRADLAPRPFWLNREYIHGMGICHQSLFVRTDLAQKHPFNERYRIAADYDSILRIHAEDGSTHYVPGAITVFDRTGVSSTHKKEGFRETAKILHRYGTPQYWFYYLRKFYYYRIEWVIMSRLRRK